MVMSEDQFVLAASTYWPLASKGNGSKGMDEWRIQRDEARCSAPILKYPVQGIFEGFSQFAAISLQARKAT